MKVKVKGYCQRRWLKEYQIKVAKSGFLLLQMSCPQSAMLEVFNALGNNRVDVSLMRTVLFTSMQLGNAIRFISILIFGAR